MNVLRFAILYTMMRLYNTFVISDHQKRLNIYTSSIVSIHGKIGIGVIHVENKFDQDGQSTVLNIVHDLLVNVF